MISSRLSYFLSGLLASLCSVYILLYVVLLSNLVVVLVITINAVRFNVSIIVKLFEHIYTIASGLFFDNTFIRLCVFSYLFYYVIL